MKSRSLVNTLHIDGGRSNQNAINIYIYVNKGEVLKTHKREVTWILSVVVLECIPTKT